MVNVYVNVNVRCRLIANSILALAYYQWQLPNGDYSVIVKML